ncbi:hypothetical protein B0J11DRAFT_146022 [Dendryphion nanum]|uniref:Uncharacterized protein n=1 Tax=Dendryphion nanum TaxID=256645 RepID=A0A9P9IB86_9PLEO|nr:hypothetical protein B0J11DRAFT_146022 [Dendryphion nanum]
MSCPLLKTSIIMAKEFHEDPNFKAWGPFISDKYVIAPITEIDIIVGGVIFGLSMVFAILATYIGILQTRSIRRPFRSAYVWMIWLEIAACIAIAIECLFYLLKVLRPSFYFYMSMLLLWSIQVQLLLQIIINRIRVILSDRRKGRNIMIIVFVLVTLIIITVFSIWIPARLQISETFIHINEIWDRVEKCLYLLIDVILNWYFIRVVKRNLVNNGLGKYNKLVVFNQRMIIISLLMDVMIIAAMSIPNGFVYASFHPLAYLVKLNIEMIMANLIKKIAVATSYNQNDLSMLYEFAATAISETGSLDKTTPRRSTYPDTTGRHRSSFLDFIQLTPKPNQIRKTEEYVVQSALKTDIQLESQKRNMKFNTQKQQLSY